jgi:hypothetical protein
MVAKASDLAQEVLAKAAELPADERELVARTLGRMPPRTNAPDVAERHAVIAERVRRVHAGEVETVSLEEVERDLRAEID